MLALRFIGLRSARRSAGNVSDQGIN